MRRRLALLVTAAMTLTAGCSADKAAPPTTSTTTVPQTTTPPPVASIDSSSAGAYFAALAAGDAATAAASAAPDSDAALFAQHQITARQLSGDAAASVASPSSTDPGYSICGSDGGCTLYGSLDVDPVTDLLRGFTTDGVPVRGRLVANGPIAAANGLDITVVSAYQSAAGRVSVIVEITNTSAATLRPFGFAAVYLLRGAANGIQTTGAWGADTIAPGATERMLLSFPSAALGGRISMAGLRSDDLDVTLDVEVPAA